MDDPNGRPPSADATELQHQQQQQPQPANAALDGATNRSSQSPGPATPNAAADSSDDYFDPATNLRQQPSRQSGPSASQFPGTLGPAGDSRLASRNRRPSIRIRRGSNPSSDNAAAAASSSSSDALATVSSARTGRPRSASQPSLDAAARTGDGARNSRRTPQVALPRLTEEGSRPTMQELGLTGSPLSPTASLPGSIARNRPESLRDDPGPSQQPPRRRFSRFWPGGNGASQRPSQDTMSRGSTLQDEEYEEHLVDILDTIDPEIQTLSTLTNIQNSLFVPDLGNLINRRPTFTLTQHGAERIIPRPATSERRASVARQEPRTDGIALDDTIQELPTEEEAEAEAPTIRRTDTITSQLSDSHYAALPHGVTLANWTPAEKWELDDHVRHMLHSRRSKFKRMMKGFGQYVRQPLGFLVTLYATLITAFGLAWVLFLIGWIYVGDRQKYTLHIIDSVLVALFLVVGGGMAPFRAMDTYHLVFVVHYWRKVRKARLKKADIEAVDRSESSNASGASATDAANKDSATDDANKDSATDAANKEPSVPNQVKQAGQEQTPVSGALSQPPKVLEADFEEEEDEDEDLYPLTPKQRKSFLHHRHKLVKSHSFYKPHETFTHYKFPLSLLIVVILLLDAHSCLQISLSSTTWGIDYHHRHSAITTTILCVSITSNIVAGLVIMSGDRKTRKKDVVQLKDRQELTCDAMKKLEEKKKKKKKKKKRQGKQEEEDTPHILSK
ncbi:hypothetical protein MY10362_007432 [Beauveria mimosiformis]